MSKQVDVILSSGFLAFARQAGVLAAIEDAQLAVGAIVGTSSGALVGALWAAGHRGEELARLLTLNRPLAMMRLHLRPWRGLFSLRALLAFLTQNLPATFEELPIPFAVGVVDSRGDHQLLTKGALPCAVAASCAMPYVFAPIDRDNGTYADGGAVDRLAFRGWKRWRGERAVIAHRVRKTAGTDLADDLGDALLIETPRSGATFWSLGDFHGQLREATEIATAAIDSRYGPHGG